MADSKVYLNVPYAQKDAAKALGARWDAANKKWFIPADKDVSLFEKWQPQAGPLESSAAAVGAPSGPKTANRASVNNASDAVITHATVKDFVAYNGVEPPWD